LNRKFIKISLGGIRDEAEIRGHRRTYVGALPGRIIQSIIQAKSSNPVFMLDEIDKVGADYRGDPSAALLEALDPEQNQAFSDHYLEVPFDLSDVMFITTANVLDTIPPALLDRMEVIRFTSYSDEEKEVIAKNYTMPKVMQNTGMRIEDLVIKEEVWPLLIRPVGFDAGLRQLERNLATLVRSAARKIVEGAPVPIVISPENVREFVLPDQGHLS
jgi:ATP-dependent Lon protease